jgi:hypothetical protein
MPDWRSADDYAFCATLTRDQWAWEFLRRNPHYQSDYQRFIAIWRSLEADYGAPPRRDFQRWKQDPRAYGPLPGETSGEPDTATGDLCIGENDRVFIECWMGAKWGFHKFPLDPAQVTPPGPDELSWRPPPATAVRAVDDVYRLDIPFDLSLPLPPQLEAAKFRLASRVSGLRHAGIKAPLSVANQRAGWTLLLRVLDAHRAGARPGILQDAGLCEDDTQCNQRLSEALAMVQERYLNILWL